MPSMSPILDRRSRPAPDHPLAGSSPDAPLADATAAADPGSPVRRLASFRARAPSDQRGPITPARHRGALPVVIGLLVALGTPGEASVRDWLTSRGGKQRPTIDLAAMPTTGNAARPAKVRAAVEAAQMPEFFKVAEGGDGDGTTGGADLRSRVELHWTTGKKALQPPAQRLGVVTGSRRLGEMSAKLFALATQLSRESLKTGLGAHQHLSSALRGLEAMTRRLGQSITSPQQETLAKVEQLITQMQDGFDAIGAQTRAGLTAAEGLTALAGESLQTLELLPSLRVPPIDLLMAGSKSLATQLKAENEATRGMLLNIAAAAEQGRAGLVQMRTTLQRTLRFSDHFAFAQYPLVNLPVPAREKVFSQVTNVDASLKAIGNVLKLAESHLRNVGERHQQLFQGTAEKMQEALRFQKPVDENAGELPQLLTYAHNQVYGLFLRGKESVTRLRTTVARAQTDTRPVLARGERTAQDLNARARAAVAREQLPLFLLGTNPAVEAGATRPSHKRPMSLEAPGESVQTLYSDRGGSDGGFMRAERGTGDGADGGDDLLLAGDPGAGTAEREAATDNSELAVFRPDELDLLAAEATELAPLLNDYRERQPRATPPPAPPPAAVARARSRPGRSTAASAVNDFPTLPPDDAATNPGITIAGEEDALPTPMARIEPDEREPDLELMKLRDWEDE